MCQNSLSLSFFLSIGEGRSPVAVKSSRTIYISITATPGPGSSPGKARSLHLHNARHSKPISPLLLSPVGGGGSEPRHQDGKLTRLLYFPFSLPPPFYPREQRTPLTFPPAPGPGRARRTRRPLPDLAGSLTDPEVASHLPPSASAASPGLALAPGVAPTDFSPDLSPPLSFFSAGPFRCLITPHSKRRRRRRRPRREGKEPFLLLLSSPPSNTGRRNVI